ncbi:tRNA (adenosine(37)-N6)-threonylcarbamoyltransferase complex dimerization subunit type 1 TsaB [Ampullimonas aquatilis]|uniref:tRNA (adenosine(37)-N6)-threonylcarbamoyltransferase complex dimerization subunit type 1 TsaB n=1 Tax=Ampullimonas aquatilis TaxID=1341549 RepID=UPI003C7835F4
MVARDLSIVFFSYKFFYLAAMTDPKLLAIEASTEWCSVALLGTQSPVFWVEQTGSRSSQRILPMVREVLAQAGVNLQQCEAIAFGCGPGSFTGLRTVCAVVQGLAYPWDIPVLPVTTLQSLAEQARPLMSADQQSGRIATVLDARMGEVYWAVYEARVAGVCLVEAGLASPSDCANALLAMMDQQPLSICGNGVSLYPELLIRLGDEVSVIAKQSNLSLLGGEGQADWPNALGVATVAQQFWAAGQRYSAAQAQPLYVRNKVALTTAERLAQKAAQVM